MVSHTLVSVYDDGQKRKRSQHGKSDPQPTEICESAEISPKQRTYLLQLSAIRLFLIRLTITQIRRMPSYPKEVENEKFGRLPLSNSGPEECALTVCHKAGIWEL